LPRQAALNPAVAGALLLAAWSAAPVTNAAGRCPSGRVVTRSKAALVVERTQRRFADRVFVGCVRDHAPVVLDVDDGPKGEDIALHFAIRGSWIAWAHYHNYTEEFWIDVDGCDARTHRGFIHRFDYPANQPAVKTLAVTPFGAVAVGLVDAFGNHPTEIRLVDRQGERTVARGKAAVDAASLRVGSHTAAWTEAGRRRQVSLARRPTTGSRCLPWRPGHDYGADTPREG
jgi:hypothetical protein